MKVGFCSTEGILIDEHFGRSEKIFVYDVSVSKSSFIEERCVVVAEPNREHLDAIDEKINQIKDCKILYFTQIGGPAAAKLIKNNIFPIKIEGNLPIKDTISMLQKSFENPPIWIKKLLQAEDEAN